MTDERRKALMYHPPALDERQHVVLRHDGKGYLFAIFEPLDKNLGVEYDVPEDRSTIEFEPEPFITFEDIEVMHNVQLISMEMLMHYTLDLIDWAAVPKGEFRTIAQASGLRVDDIHKVIAASLEPDDQLAMPDEEKDKPHTLWRSLRKRD